MSGNARKRRSLWDSKEETQLSDQRHPSHDLKSSDLEAENVLKSKEYPDWPRELSPGKSGQKDANRDLYDNSQVRMAGDVDKSYHLSLRNHGPGPQNHSRSPEGSWGHSRRRSRSRSRGRGRATSRSRSRGRKRSLSRGRDRSRSLSRGRDRGYGRSRSPLKDYRREPHGWSDRRTGFGASLICRDYNSGNCRRGSQCRFLHQDSLNQRDGGRSERDRPERWGTRGERGGNRYDGDREESTRNSSKSSMVCNDFLKGRCSRGLSCRYSHHDAVGDNSSKRQHMGSTLCKFFMMGKCSRDNCRFSHDVTMHGDQEPESQNVRWDNDYDDQNKSWNGPTWDEAKKQDDDGSGQILVVQNDAWNGPKWGDATIASDIAGTIGWGNSNIENVNATDPMIGKRYTEDRSNHSLDNERKMWDAPEWKDKHAEIDKAVSLHLGIESHVVGMDIAGSDVPKEINKEEAQSNLDDMQCQTPYGFSMNAEASSLQQPASTVSPSEFLENSQIKPKMGENILTAGGFDSVNGGDIYGNARQTTLVPGQSFGQNSGTFGLHPPHFGGTNQGQPIISVNPSNGHNIDLNGPVQENFSPFKVQNSLETQHREFIKTVLNSGMPQMNDNKPVQITNLSASLTQIFANEQLPQLYAALNPPKSTGSMPSLPDSASLFPITASINTQPDQLGYQKYYGDGMEPKNPDNCDQYPGNLSNPIGQKNPLPLGSSSPSGNVGLDVGEVQKNGCPTDNNQMSLQLSQQKVVSRVVEEERNSIDEKCNQEPETNGAGNEEADARVGDGTNGKDEKAMRLFKVSLVEFVKEILKPKWKEGQMSREVHKAIVKKVVDKVTSATQGVNIPSTQAKVDQYLSYSKPKLTKLVEAYIERFSKDS